MPKEGLDLWKKLYMKELDTKKAHDVLASTMETQEDKIKTVIIKGRTYRIDNNYKPARITEIKNENQGKVQR